MISRIGLLPHMHRAVEYNGTIYIGGVVADDNSLSIKEQTRQVVTKIDELLAQHGSSKEKLLMATIFVVDLGLKGEMNEVWMSWLDPDIMPARATVGISDLGSGYLIEVTAVAAK